MNLQASVDLNCVVVKQGNEYCVKSEDRSKNLGCKPSKSGAEKRLRQVEYFKHLKGGGVGSGRHSQGSDLRYDSRQKSLFGPGHTDELHPMDKQAHNSLTKHGWSFKGTTYPIEKGIKNKEEGMSKYIHDTHGRVDVGNNFWIHQGNKGRTGTTVSDLKKHISSLGEK